MKANPLPPIERLRELFFYPPPTGELYWLKTRNSRAQALDEAGFLDNTGYLRVRIDGKQYQIHRIIFAMRHNVEVSTSIEIDHKDLNRTNNHIDNLRIATPSQNQRNRPIGIKNTSGYRGVSWHKGVKKWAAQINFDGKNNHLGYYATKEEAALAYNAAALKYHGEFAYLNKVDVIA